MLTTAQTQVRLFVFAAAVLVMFTMKACKANELLPNVTLTPDPA